MEGLAWIGLVVSWLLLVVLLKFVFLVLRVLKQARRLAQMSRDAARGIVDNLAHDEAFAELELLARQLPQAVQGLPRSAAAAGPRVSSSSPGIGGRFS